MTVREEKRKLYLLLSNLIHEHEKLIKDHEPETSSDCLICEGIRSYRKNVAELEGKKQEEVK